jgi:23S rRNA (cytidine1920-2'-O)/16S rRNA (cytidine1409-2'-O)-methyltransferase
MRKERLDLLLVERGLVSSRALAQRLVMAGQVRAGGQLVLKSATKVNVDIDLVIDEGRRFVSRGGEKLEAALRGFKLPVEGRICADVGASTGGFTDCLLQHGAARVYAIDVGRGILDWSLRQHARVVVMEGTNARFIQSLPEPVSLVVMDASFISLKILLPVVKDWFLTHRGPHQAVPDVECQHVGDVIALIKPQFEAGKEEARRGKGVIRDPDVHARVLIEVLSFAHMSGYGVRGLLRSPLEGPKGNQEFLSWLSWPAEASADINSLVTSVIQAEQLDKE